MMTPETILKFAEFGVAGAVLATIAVFGKLMLRMMREHREALKEERDQHYAFLTNHMGKLVKSIENMADKVAGCPRRED